MAHRDDEPELLCRLVTADGRSLTVTREGGRTVARDGADVVAIAGSPEELAVALAGVGFERAVVGPGGSEKEVAAWIVPAVEEGFRVSWADDPDYDDYYDWIALRGRDGALYIVPNDIDETEIIDRSDSSEDCGVVTFDLWEYICRLDDLYLVYVRGDSPSITPVGRFADPVEGLRAAAEASDYFRFDEETGSVVPLVEDYETRYPEA